MMQQESRVLLNKTATTKTLNLLKSNKSNICSLIPHLPLKVSRPQFPFTLGDYWGAPSTQKISQVGRGDIPVHRLIVLDI